jgi:hypothetical protein
LQICIDTDALEGAQKNHVIVVLGGDNMAFQICAISTPLIDNHQQPLYPSAIHTIDLFS